MNRGVARRSLWTGAMAVGGVILLPAFIGLLVADAYGSWWGGGFAGVIVGGEYGNGFTLPLEPVEPGLNTFACRGDRGKGRGMLQKVNIAAIFW